MPQPHDFLVKSQAKSEEKAPAEDAVFTYFGPEDAQERFRFLVVREGGDLISILPSGDARFKTGWKALRWEKAEGGEPTTYLVVKTRPRRVDLRKL